MVGQKVGDPGGRELDRGVNRHSDLQIFYFFRLLTIFFVIFTEIVEVAKGLYRWKA